MNLLDLIPGDRISGESFNNISTNILLAINPEKLPPLERFNQFKIRTKQEIMDLIQNSSLDEYYILYTHPVKGKESRLYVSKKSGLLNFIDSRFNEERGDGMDIIVSDELYESLIVGNHDGMLLEA